MNSDPYVLIHRPDLDATEYRLGPAPGDPLTSLDVVTFTIRDPADEHEREVRLTMSRPAWESQGSPEELWIRLLAPGPTGAPNAG